MAYVSFVQDAWTRHVLGFTVADREDASLVVRSVKQAESRRRRQDPPFTSDGASTIATPVVFGPLMRFGASGNH